MQRSTTFGLALLLGTALANAAVPQRTFVSTAGNDANAASGCGLVAPCRSFDTAIGAVASNGEVVALDSGGYGRFTVTKSVTVAAPPGVYAGISVFSGTNGVDINTAGVNVILRGLVINGQGGANGINFQSGDSLVVENCVINTMASAGILATAAGVNNDHPSKAQVVNTTISRNTTGIQLNGGPISLTLTRSAVVRNTDGILALGSIGGAENTLTVQASTVSSSDNGSGIYINPGISGSIVTAVVSGSTIDANWNNGIYIQGVTGSETFVTLTGNVVSGNFNGVAVSSSGTAKTVLGENSISRNRSAGVFTGGIILSRGDNTINHNAIIDLTGAMGSIGGQ
jgi:hypothetical protein